MAEIRFTIRNQNLIVGDDDLALDGLIQDIDNLMYDVAQMRKTLCGDEVTTSPRVTKIMNWYKNNPPS